MSSESDHRSIRWARRGLIFAEISATKEGTSDPKHSPDDGSRGLPGCHNVLKPIRAVVCKERWHRVWSPQRRETVTSCTRHESGAVWWDD